jgi:hypothetical protein
MPPWPASPCEPVPSASRRWGAIARALVLCVVPALAGACASGQTAVLEAVPAQTATVNQTLVVPLIVENGSTSSLSFRFRGPDVPNLVQTTSISSNGGVGEFRWTPVASHVGTHEFTFLLVSSDDVVDEKTTIITVVPADDAAPVFLRPGAGGTYDLTTDPCVRFEAEVRDADTLDVEIRPRENLPEGATLTPIDGKRTAFEWCPTSDQVALQDRWTVLLEADDGEHTPTPHDYVVVLRSAPKDNCPGEAPTVSIVTPASNAKLTSEPGFTITLEVTDDMGLRDAPLLYYSTTTPDDPSNPDLTVFEQVTTIAGVGNRWTARIPSLALAPGEERAVYIVASATDNDDAGGVACDLTTDTPLRKFTAVGSGTLAADCTLCTFSAECASGACGESSNGDRCMRACGAGGTCAAGQCTSVTTTEGAVVSGCGPVDTACGLSGNVCTDDGFEPNDSLGQAKSFSVASATAQVCAGNRDFYRIAGLANQRVAVTVDNFMTNNGDLDLALYSEAGSLIDLSDSLFDTETVSHCLMSAGNVFASVYGYQTAENAYRIRVSTATASCCVDDDEEQDDTFASARTLSGTDFDGTLCPGDEDFVSFTAASGTRIDVTLIFDDTAGDLDLALFGPTGTVVASSQSTSDNEEISFTASAGGKYAVRVRGFGSATNTYAGMVTLTAAAPCADTKACALGSVCDMTVCEPEGCALSADCPSDHTCTTEGGSKTTKRCASECSVNSDCRSSEACKRLWDGRLCDRTGSGQNGDACTEHSDCGGQRACLAYPGGYCARADCSANSDCEAGTFCVAVSGKKVCAKDCANAACRTGYACAAAVDMGGTARSVCTP